MPHKPSILLLTEDTGSSAHEVLRAVVEKLLFAAGHRFDPSQRAPTRIPPSASRSPRIYRIPPAEPEDD